MMFSRIGKDKWKHFYVGIGLGLLFEWIALLYFPSARISASLIVFAVIVAICYGFELFSLIFKRGHYDIIDAVAGILGGLLGMAVLLFFF